MESYNEALEAYQVAVMLKPKDLTVLIEKKNVHKVMGDAQRTFDACNAIIAVDKENAETGDSPRVGCVNTRRP
jgi:hypothetical protein